MRRRYRVFRGEQLLGYVGFDDEWPCEPFEPAESFAEWESLFTREHELSMKASERDCSGADAGSLMQAADEVMEQILAPGVRFEAMEEILCSFDCDQLSIFNGRVCWR